MFKYLRVSMYVLAGIMSGILLMETGAKESIVVPMTGLLLGIVMTSVAFCLIEFVSVILKKKADRRLVAMSKANIDIND